ECRLPDFMSGRDDAFAAANPRLEVPALVDGDTRVFDSTIILEYIEDRWPTPPLLPVAPAERARVRMLEELCDTYVEPISWAAMGDPRLQARHRCARRAAPRARRRAGGGRAALPRAAARRSALVQRRGLRLGRPVGRPLCPGHRLHRHPAPGGHASRRLARAGERAAERRRRLRGR